MTRLALVIMSAIVAAGCSSPTPSPEPSAVTTLASATPGAPTAPASTPRPTPTPVPPGAGLCPTNTPLTPLEFVESDTACFVGREIEIRGWLDEPPAIGFEPPGVAPGWLYYTNEPLTTLYEGRPIGEFQECQMDGRACASFFLHVDPASGVALKTLPRWVIVTGHVDDPAAATCHYTYPEGWTEPHLDDQLAIALCRAQFVVVSVRDAP